MVSLDDREFRGILIGIGTSVIAGIITWYLATNYITKTANTTAQATAWETARIFNQSQLSSLSQRKHDNIHMENIFSMQESKSKSKLKLKITTCEYYNNIWNPVVRHTFYGNTIEEINNLIEAHKMTDSFFSASFTGTFNWNGSDIQLKNDISELDED